jgi:hypothetical protein
VITKTAKAIAKAIVNALLVMIPPERPASDNQASELDR